MVQRSKTPAVGRKVRVGRVREVAEGSLEETMGSVHLAGGLI